MSTVRLSTTSYVVLGLVEQGQPASPYDLKRAAEGTTDGFWTIAHTQLYTECTRLAREGLLDEQQEATGRRRKLYRVTEAGLSALEAWRRAPMEERLELRDPGILKLFFGAEPHGLAGEQLAFHTRRLGEYEQMSALDLPAGMALALRCGIGHEREYVRFWGELAGEDRPADERADG